MPVSETDRSQQMQVVYAKIGRVSAASERLRTEMNYYLVHVLCIHGLNQQYAFTILTGHNLESLRRLWLSLTKMHYQGDPDALKIIGKIGNRIDAATQKRNDTIHRDWLVGWGNEDTERFDVAEGHVLKRDYKSGGLIADSKDSNGLDEIGDLFEELTQIILKMTGCILKECVFPETMGQKFLNTAFIVDKAGVIRLA